MRENHHKHWTSREESKLLYLVWKGRTNRQIGLELGRTTDAIAQHRREMAKRENPPTFRVEDYEGPESIVEEQPENNSNDELFKELVELVKDRSDSSVEESKPKESVGLEVFFNGQKLEWRKGTRIITKEFVIDTDVESVEEAYSKW